ncbi:hypothetical protein BMAJHU_C0794, partial [Burkholderia mallei JHU]
DFVLSRSPRARPARRFALAHCGL